jgi:hypothetical protein
MISTLRPMSAVTKRSAKYAAVAATDAKQRERSIAKKAQAEAIEIKNDVA